MPQVKLFFGLCVNSTERFRASEFVALQQCFHSSAFSPFVVRTHVRIAQFLDIRRPRPETDRAERFG
jgi:hypothetical protein